MMYRLDSQSATFYASSFSVCFSFVSLRFFNSVKVMVRIGCRVYISYRFDCEFISIDRFGFERPPLCDVVFSIHSIRLNFNFIRFVH